MASADQYFDKWTHRLCQKNYFFEVDGFFTWFIFFLLLFFFTLITSCTSTERQSAESITNANLLLDGNQCDQAITELGKVNPTYYNYYFYQTKSAALACKAGYKELTLLTALKSVNSSAIFNGLAAMSTSVESSATSDGFVYLQQALDVILATSGTSDVLVANRRVTYNSTHGDDLSFQALMMIISYLGKWLYYYGKADSSGNKGLGDGSGGVSCLYDYPNTVAFTTLIDLNTSDSCTSSNLSTEGHPDLQVSSTTTQTQVDQRGCYFLIYFNHLIDQLTNLSISSNDSLGSLSSFGTNIATLKSSTLSYYDYSALLSIYRMDSCLSYLNTSAANRTTFLAFFAALVEKEYQ